MNQNAESLIARIPESASTARKAATLALNTAAEFARRRDEMRRSGTYTQSGVSQALRGALPDALKQIGLTRSTVEKMKREVNTKRAALLPTDADRSDLVGALDRQEARTFLRGLEPTERAVVLTKTTDLRLLQAAILAPPELTLGPNPDQEFISRVEARYAELTNPAAVAEATDIETTANELAAIVEVAQASLQQTSDLSAHQFAEEVRKCAGKIWLVGDAGREQVVELDADGRATYRQASPDEVAAGVRYANADEYMAA